MVPLGSGALCLLWTMEASLSGPDLLFKASWHSKPTAKPDSLDGLDADADLFTCDGLWPTLNKKTRTVTALVSKNE